MVYVQNKYKNTLVGVLRTHITFITHSSPECYVTLRTQVIRLNSGNLGPQKTDSGVFIILYIGSFNNIKSNSHCVYIGTPVLRPPLLHQICDLSRGVASHQG